MGTCGWENVCDCWVKVFWLWGWAENPPATNISSDSSVIVPPFLWSLLHISPFSTHPLATCEGFGLPHRPISSQTKGDVERELEQAGISRFTYDWRLGPVEDLAWNAAVVEVVAWKLVEWIWLSTCITNDIAAQAPAIVQCWLRGKCCEIQKNKNWNAGEDEAQKKVKLAKAKLTQWWKKVHSDLVLFLLVVRMLLINPPLCLY